MAAEATCSDGSECECTVGQKGARLTGQKQSRQQQRGADAPPCAETM